MPFRFLRCIAKAIAKHGVRFFANLIPGGEVIYDIAGDVWEDYRREGQEDRPQAFQCRRSVPLTAFEIAWHHPAQL